jgi:adenylate kinase family enzyme
MLYNQRMDHLPAENDADFMGRSPRIVVMGSTGSGKTTLAQQISRTLDVPHVELDALHWEHDWIAAPTDVFRRRVFEALEGDIWVADGNYTAVRDLVWPRATALVWLNYPLRVLMWQLLSRTLRRTLRKEELWNGNRERFFLQFFSRESLFLWLFRSYWRRRRTYLIAFNEPEHSHLEIVILRSTKETRAWLSKIGVA